MAPCDVKLFMAVTIEYDPVNLRRRLRAECDETIVKGKGSKRSDLAKA
jgi:hypothetical protein